MIKPRIKNDNCKRKTRYFKRDTQEGLINTIYRKSGIQNLVEQINIRDLKREMHRKLRGRSKAGFDNFRNALSPTLNDRKDALLTVKDQHNNSEFHNKSANNSESQNSLLPPPLVRGKTDYRNSRLYDKSEKTISQTSKTI